MIPMREFVAVLALGCLSGVSSDECSQPVEHLASVSASTAICSGDARGSLQNALAFLHEQKWLNLANAETKTSLRVACGSACFAKLGMNLLGEVPEQCNEHVRVFEPASADTAVTILRACRGSFPYSIVGKEPIEEQKRFSEHKSALPTRPVANVVTVRNPISATQECTPSIGLISSVHRRTPACHGARRQQLVDALVLLQKDEGWISLPTKQSWRHLEIACRSFCFANVAPVIEHRVPKACQESATFFSPATPRTVMSVYHACLKRMPHSATAKMYISSAHVKHKVRVSHAVIDTTERPVPQRVVVARQTSHQTSHVVTHVVTSHNTLVFLLLALFVGCICLLTLWMHAVHRPGPSPKVEAE